MGKTVWVLEKQKMISRKEITKKTIPSCNPYHMIAESFYLRDLMNRKMDIAVRKSALRAAMAAHHSLELPAVVGAVGGMTDPRLRMLEVQQELMKDNFTRTANAACGLDSMRWRCSLQNQHDLSASSKGLALLRATSLGMPKISATIPAFPAAKSKSDLLLSEKGNLPYQIEGERLYIDKIRDMDVLCGRGGRSNHHPGN